MNTDGYRKVTAGVKGGERLVLALIAMCEEEGEVADAHRLADDSGMCVKQVLRITAKLKAAGRINAEGGEGRTPYVFTLASDYGDKMSSQVNEPDKRVSRQDKTSAQVKISENNLSPLSDVGTKCPDKGSVSGDKMSGTPVAPSKAKNTSTEREANASRAVGAVSLQAYIGRLIQFREHELGTKLPAHQTEAAAAKWMFQQGWPPGEVEECYHFLVGQGKRWRGKGVTLNDVKSAIADWKKGNLSDGTRTEPQQPKPTRSERIRGRDYSWAEPEGGGADVGADSRPLPHVNGLAALTRR